MRHESKTIALEIKCPPALPVLYFIYLTFSKIRLDYWKAHILRLSMTKITAGPEHKPGVQYPGGRWGG